MELTDIDGVGDSMAEKLRSEGFSFVDDVAEADEFDLRKVEGVGDGNATDLRSNARDVIQASSLPEDDGEEEEDNEDEAPDEGERPNFVEEEDNDVDTSVDEEVQSLSELQESDDESGEEDEEDEEEEDSGPYPLTLSVSETQFDAFVASLFYVKTQRSSSNPDQSRVASTVLDEFRDLGGEGEKTAELSADQINTLYTALLQSENRYQADSTMNAFHDVSDVKDQVDEVRREHLY